MPILAGAAAVAALAWAYLLAAHGGYWRTDQRLPPGAHDASRAPARWPSVTAVVPARDEAAILPVTLPSLLAQDYPGEFSVVVVADASTDGTAATAAELAAGTGRRLLVTTAGEPPPGWAGKVHAMARGLDTAGDCDYVLFTDADIGYAPDVLATLVRGAVADDRGLVSQMALLRAESGWERVIVPAFVYFFAQLYPFRRVNRPSARTAAAAGGCMLVHRGTLIAAGGLDPIRGARIDDVALGRLLKHPPSAAAVAGLASVAAGGGAAAGWTALAGLAGWALMSVSFLPALRLYRLGWWRAPALPLVAGLYALMTADSARRHYAGRGGEWKGRTVAAPRGQGVINRP